MAELPLKQHNPSVSAVADPSGTVAARYRQLLNALELLNIMIIETDIMGAVRFANKPAVSHLSSGRTNDCELMSYLVSFAKEIRDFPALTEIYDPLRNIWLKITTNRIAEDKDIFIHIIEDISSWKINESELKLSAAYDELTGVYNRKAGLEFLNSLLNDKKSDSVHCVAFIDVDGLKDINDLYGHNEGDYALKAIASVMLSSVRGSDAVFRYGGDEFIIIFVRCSEERANHIIDRMIKKLVVLDIEEPKPYKMRFSYGTVAFRADAYGNPEELIVLADKKMYHNKVTYKMNRKIR